MLDYENIKYIAVVQCDIVQDRCSGFLCEKAFTERTGGFKNYPADKQYRTLYITCGGCCGKAVLRKLSNLTRQAKKQDGIEKDEIAVQLSSCITKDNHHSSVCPHIDYIKQQVEKAGLKWAEDTRISPTAERRRAEGIYES